MTGSIKRAGWCAGLVALALLASSCAATRPGTAFDFDGDGKADFAWVDHTGTWRRGSATDNVVIGTTAPAANLAPGDYDGDGRVEIAAWTDTGTWVTGGGAGTFEFPKPPVSVAATWRRVVPVPGRYDGGVKDIPAWYRDSDGTWFIQGKDPIQFGNGATNPLGNTTVDAIDQDFPVPADYDGDGITDLAVYSPRTGSYRIRSSVNGSVTDRTLLSTTGVDWLILPVPGDYDGVGHAQAAVFGGTTGWVIEGHAAADPFGSVPLGTPSNARPAPADYDGDGTMDPAVVWWDGRWQVEKTGTTVQLPGTSFDYLPPAELAPGYSNIGPATLVGRCLTGFQSPCT